MLCVAEWSTFILMQVAVQFFSDPFVDVSFFFFNFMYLFIEMQRERERERERGRDTGRRRSRLPAKFGAQHRL